MFKLLLSLFLLSVIIAHKVHHFGKNKKISQHLLPQGTYNIAYIKESFPGFENIVFNIDGNSIGFSGCNTNRGSYELTKDNKFTTTPMWMSTRRACSEDYDGVVFNTVLSSDEAYSSGNCLIFISEGEAVLVLSWSFKLLIVFIFLYRKWYIFL